MIPFYKSSCFNVIIGDTLLSNILLEKHYLEEDKKQNSQDVKLKEILATSIIHIKNEEIKMMDLLRVLQPDWRHWHSTVHIIYSYTAYILKCKFNITNYKLYIINNEDFYYDCILGKNILAKILRSLKRGTALSFCQEGGYDFFHCFWW